MGELLLTLALTFFTALQWVSNLAFSPPIEPVSESQVVAVASVESPVKKHAEEKITSIAPTSSDKKEDAEAFAQVSDKPITLPQTQGLTITIDENDAPTREVHTVTPLLTPPSPNLDYESAIAVEILALTNAERVTAGLVPLLSDTLLASVAHSHSFDMLTNDYFSHEDRTGCSSSCRATNAGYSWSTVGENIYMMSGYNLDAKKTAQMIVDGWMNSSGHRANILRPAFTHAGIGVFVRGKDVYSTALYAKPRN